VKARPILALLGVAAGAALLASLVRRPPSAPAEEGAPAAASDSAGARAPRVPPVTPPRPVPRFVVGHEAQPVPAARETDEELDRRIDRVRRGLEGYSERVPTRDEHRATMRQIIAAAHRRGEYAASRMDLTDDERARLRKLLAAQRAEAERLIVAHHDRPRPKRPDASPFDEGSWVEDPSFVHPFQPLYDELERHLGPTRYRQFQRLTYELRPEGSGGQAPR
jgi:hypothetical protein